MPSTPPLPLLLEPLLKTWLLEDIGRADHSSKVVSINPAVTSASWIAKQAGVIAGLPIAAQVFQILNPHVQFDALIAEGQRCEKGQQIAHIQGPIDALLTGERVALNIAMRLSGIASSASEYVERIRDLPTRLVDTRKTTPGLRILEKYAMQVGGAMNHRMGLDDGVMLKDNHIAAAGGISQAIAQIRQHIPYPLTIEVETETLEQVQEALDNEADIIMLDNMPIPLMQQAVQMIRQCNPKIRIEASGNITLDTIRSVAETGVDYISSSAPITRSPWLDLSMRIKL
jgi:nicotinate-nucleotide pyrophosphorylase (carboxylating)